MSWRLLIVSLLIFAGLATWGGLQAGDWLIAHAPTKANIPNVTESDPPPQVDNEGRPVLRQPQQPLISGAQGVPEPTIAVDWKIKPEINSTLQAVKKTEQENQYITMGKASGSLDLIPGKTKPIQIKPIKSINNSNAWEGAFQHEVARCRTLGFFDRPSCLTHARAQYCAPNNAWGKVTDCPSR